MFPWLCASSDACFVDGRVSNLDVVHRAMSVVPHIYALLGGVCIVRGPDAARFRKKPQSDHLVFRLCAGVMFVFTGCVW
jgi:hypothetical protein